MATLVSTLLALGAVLALGRLPPPVRPADRATRLRRALAVSLLVLPLLYGAWVLAGARERTRVLRFDYVGKRLAFGPGSPLTAGGSPWDAEEVEDLHAPRLRARALRLEPLPSGAAEGPEDGGREEGRAAPAAVLRLASPSPAVRVDEGYCNSVPLAAGDEIVVDRGRRSPLRLTFQGRSLRGPGGEWDLQSSFGQLAGGRGRIYPLSGFGEEAAGVFSLLHRPAPFRPWELLIRSREVRLERGGAVVAAFAEQCPVPAAFDLSLELALGGRLRSQRRDHLRIGDGEVEVRFAEPWRWAVAVLPRQPQTALALVVPATFARREMIELPEPSSRFRGLTALHRYDRRTDVATLTFLGDTQQVVPGDLYALGTDRDRMLLRLDRQAFPWHLLWDLALLSLFLGVFLGRGVAAHAGLAAVVGPTGLLLAHRLLFSHKASTQPPDFALEAFQEARLALWLVPALLLAAWGLAWLLRQPAAEGGEGTSTAAGGGGVPGAAVTGTSVRTVVGRLAWPLGGLAASAAGCLAVSAGGGPGRRALALLPLLLAALLALAAALLRRPRPAACWNRVQRHGLPWKAWWIAPLGLAILLLRWLAALAGMPETLRLPFVQFRLLWTVFQLPLAAVAVGLTLYSLRRRLRRLGGEGADLRRDLLTWLGGLGALVVFLLLAFLGVGLAVGDTGLAIVHALPALVALLLLLEGPPPLAGRPRRVRLAAAGAAVLAALPLVVFLAVNAYPEKLVKLVGWGTGVEAGEAAAAPVRDRAAQLGAERAQQMFRLYMLANPGLLREVGLRPAERVAVHYETLQSYAGLGGAFGRGYLAAELPRHLGATYLSDLVPLVFVLTEFGKAGLLGLALLYLALLAALPLTAGAGDTPLGGQGLFVAFVALLSLVLPSLYMILANLNLVLFTGKNLALLSLNSLSDVLQSGGLAALAVLGLGLRRGAG